MASAISPDNPIYRRRRVVNAVLLFISGLALAFGLFWLTWILITLFHEGFNALAPSLFTQNTPPPGSDERAQFYKWLLWLSSTVQATMPLYFYSDRFVLPGNEAGAAEVKAMAEIRFDALMDQLDAQLAASGGPWVLGQRYSALDPYAFMLSRWTRAMKRPARTLAHTGPFLDRMLERPAVQAMLKAEGLQAPFV